MKNWKCIRGCKRPRETKDNIVQVFCSCGSAMEEVIEKPLEKVIPCHGMCQINPQRGNN